MTELPIELTLLGWSVILLVVAVMIQGQTATLELGVDWNAGPRDGDAAPKGVIAGRAQRALDNFKESYPAFIALALALTVSERTGGIGAIGAMLWFAARIVYHPLYLFGVPYVRSLAWIASMLGLLLMLIRLL
jgi:uncharacterized MAPEG superfamily protein